MELKATIERVPRYRITINGKVHEDLVLESRWEGLAKFVTPEGGVVIIEEPPEQTDVFLRWINSLTHGGEPGKESYEARIYKLSPSLVPAKAEKGTGA